MALHRIPTYAAARRTIILGLATVLAGLFLGERLGAQTPMVSDGSGLPFTDAYQAAFGSRDVAFRLNYDTERYGQENGQFGLGFQGHRPTERGVLLYSGQYNLDFGNTDRMGLDVGLGFRVMGSDVLGTGKTRVYGATIWYDGLKTDLDNYFNQMGFSLESLGDHWDFRVNGNFAIGEVTQAGEAIHTGELGFAGAYLAEVTDVPIDEAVSVVDFEVARRVGDYDAWVFGGGYGLDASGDTCFGAKGGLRGWLGSDALLELAVSQDDFFDTKVNFALVWYPGRSPMFGHRSRCIDDRLREPVLRNDYIATRRVHQRGSAPLHDTDGDLLRIVHVYSEATSPGDGTYENPYASLNSVYGGSQNGDIILNWSGSQHTGESIVLRDLQRLLGEGNNVQHKVVTQEFGEVTLAATRAGAAAGAIPIITNTTGNVVTLAAATSTVNVDADGYDANKKVSYNEVSNLSIDGGANGIVSPAVGIGEVDINHMTIANTTGDGVRLTPFLLTKVDSLANPVSKQVLFKPTVTASSFNNVGGDDIDLDATTGEPSSTSVDEAIVIRGVASTNANGWGININDNGSAATIEQYTFDGGATALGGIQFTASRGGANVSDTTITGGSVASGLGVSLVGAVGDSIASTFTFTDTQITDTGGAGFHVRGDATNVDFSGKIVQGNNAAAVYVEGDADGAHTGTLNFNEMTTDAGVVTATAGTGLVFRDATGVYNFNHMVNLDDVSTGIDISGTDAFAGGLFTFSKAAIDNATDAALRIDGGQSVVNFTGLITQAAVGAGSAVDIKGSHSGTVTFNESVANQGIITVTAGNGLQFTNADGTYAFNDRVIISGAAGSGATAGINIAPDGTLGSDGTFTFGNAILTDINGIALNLNGGTADVSFTGQITQTANAFAAVNVEGQHSGTVNLNEHSGFEGVILANTGPGLTFDEANGTYNFNWNSRAVIARHAVQLSGTSGIDVQNSNGTFTFQDATVTNSSSTGLNIDGGMADVNFTGKISQTVNDALAVNIEGGHGGTVALTEIVTDEGVIEATSGDGLRFDNADGSYTFSDAIVIGQNGGSADMDAGISITSVGGDSEGLFTFSNAEITDIDGIAFNLNGGLATVNFTGRIEQDEYNRAVLTIGGEHTGTATFNKRSNDAESIVATAGSGLQFSNADGTYDFNHKIVVSGDTGSGATAGIGIANDSDGTFRFDQTELTDINGVALGLSGGTADITFIGKITQSKNAAAMMTIGGGHAAGTLPGEGTGTVTFSEYQTGQGIATASMGTGLQFSNADGTYDFNHKVAVSGAAGSGASEGVSITNGSDGTITFDRIMLTNVNGVSFNLNGGTADVDFKGKITQDANNVAVLTIGGGHAVGALPSEGNGTVEFTQYQTGQGIVTASMGTGLHLNQANGDYDFSHLVDINGSTATGINIQSSNGAVTFASATIDGTSSHGVSITDSANVSLSNVDINGVGGEGIHVDQSVSSTLVISNCDINTTGTNRGINMIVDSGASTSRITLLNNDVSAQNAEAVLLDIPNNVDAKTVYYLMQNNSLANTSATAPVADLDAHGNVLLNATVSTNTFNGPNVATAFTTTSNDASTTIRLKLNGNTLASTGTNIVLNGSTGTFSVEDVATISADNNGASETHAGCTNDPGGIPTP